MSTSILRITSPSAAAFKQAANTSVIAGAGPKSILRRPSSLPLSPNPMPIAQPFSMLLAPKSPGATSPGARMVRFPASPNMVSIHTALSPASYDRAAISVSPNPLALPAWGDRVFSPSSGTFRRSEIAKQASTLNRPALSVSFKEGDLLTVPGKAVTLPPSNTRAGRRFRHNLAVSALKVLPREGLPQGMELGNALTRYPRSPYPSAPLSPATKMELETGEEAMRERRASVTGATTSVRRPASLNVPRASTPIMPELSIRTVNADSSLSPLPEASFVTSERAASPETRLSNAFWESLTLEQPKSILLNGATKPAAEELDLPTSAVPKFSFKGDALWSPGLPKKMPKAMLSPLPVSAGGLLSPGLLSPGMPSPGLPSATKKAFKSPQVNDPFAGLPTFAMVMSPVVREAAL